MAVTSWKVPGTVTEDTSVGTDVWTTPSNATATGATYAVIAWATGTKTSSRIKLTNCGFTTGDVPSGATIDGIEFGYSRGETSLTDNLNTSEIYYIDSAGVLQTATNSADAGEWPTTVTAVTVGGATNKMGYTGVTDSDVRNSNFGISIRAATIGSGTTPDGQLNACQIRIYYTAAASSTVKTWDDIAKANVKTYFDIAKASVKTINNITL
jgi:hypothetical protein